MLNNYADFVSLGDDAETLNELSEAVLGEELNGTPMEGCIAGIVNSQYEIIDSGLSRLVYDKFNQERVFITNQEYTFRDVLEREIEDRCEGLDYSSYTNLMYAITKED